jgi:hypothetical protein
MELSLHLTRNRNQPGSINLSSHIENLPSEFSIIFGVFPSITATAELVVPRYLLACLDKGWHATEAVPSWTWIGNIPKSMPMTWPLTFSSPPVEAYRARNDVVGDRMLENREMGDDRGSYEKSVKRAPEW